MHRGNEVLLLRRRAAVPLVARNRIVRDLLQRHTVTAPASLELAGRGVKDDDALLIDDVDLVFDLVDLEPPFLGKLIDFLVVLYPLHAFGHAMAKVPHKLAIACELLNAFLWSCATDPDIALTVRNDSLQPRRPTRIVRSAPGVHDVAFLIQRNDLRTQHATQHGARIALGDDLEGIGRVWTIQKPDDVVIVNANSGDLLHAPLVRERLGPEWIHAIQRGAVLVYCLPFDDLRRRVRPSEHQQAASNSNRRARRCPR